MSHQPITDAQQATIEDTVKALTDELINGAEQVDVDRCFANFTDAYDSGFIDNGVFYPTLDSMIDVFRSGFSRLRSQEIEMSETRISVLAPNVAILTTHGSFTETDTSNNTSDSRFALTLAYAKVGEEWKIVHAHQSFPREA